MTYALNPIARSHEVKQAVVQQSTQLTARPAARPATQPKQKQEHQTPK